jgi:hypothetical protein
MEVTDRRDDAELCLERGMVSGGLALEVAVGLVGDEGEVYVFCKDRPLGASGCE